MRTRFNPKAIEEMNDFAYFRKLIVNSKKITKRYEIETLYCVCCDVANLGIGECQCRASCDTDIE